MPLIDGFNFSQLTNLNVTNELYFRGSPIGTGSPTPIIFGASFATQDPGVVDTPLQIEFGAAQSTADADLAANGAITINTPGIYELLIFFEFVRVSNPGNTLSFVRFLLNGSPVGNPASILISTPDTTIPFQLSAELPLSAGDVLTFEFYRDSAGTNDGILRAETSAIGWGQSPSASIRLFKF